MSLGATDHRACGGIRGGHRHHTRGCDRGQPSTATVRATEPEQLEDTPPVQRAEVVDEPPVVFLELVIVVDGRLVEYRTGLRKGRNAGAMVGADPDKLLTAPWAHTLSEIAETVIEGAPT